MDFAGKRAVVMGLGRFGGGIGAARFLASRGASVLVTDQASEEQLTSSLAALADCAVETRLGEHRETDFTEADVVVVNPAINPHRNHYVQAARASGVTITSEIRLLVERLPNRQRVIGVTGTAGKSTVTAMLGHVLKKTASDARPEGGPAVWIGGNLGGSLLPGVERIGARDWVVLELSSFMLDGLAEAAWSPGVAVVTNCSANHLDWHGSFEAYRAAKQVILDHQQAGDVAVLGPTVADWPTAREVVREVASLPDAGMPLQVPGEHNQWNAALALTAAGHAGVDTALGVEALADFAGLAHRLEVVAEANGVRAYNDSKSTTPEAAERALMCFDRGRAHLLLGGFDKGSDLQGLAQAVADHAAGVYTLGQTGAELARMIRARSGADGPIVLEAGDVANAVARACERAQPGEAIVLSPGCASWDQYPNFEHRGDHFRELARQRLGAQASA